MSRPQNNPGTVDLAPAWGWILGTLVPALLENGTSEGKEDALKLLGEAGSKLDALARFYAENPDAPHPDAEEVQP